MKEGILGTLMSCDGDFFPNNILGSEMIDLTHFLEYFATDWEKKGSEIFVAPQKPASLQTAQPLKKWKQANMQKCQEAKHESTTERAQSRIKRGLNRRAGPMGGKGGTEPKGADRGGSLGGPGRRWASSGKGGGGRSTGGGGGPGPRPGGGGGPGWGLRRSTSIPGPRGAPPGALRKDREEEEEEEQHRRHETKGREHVRRTEERRLERDTEEGGIMEEHLNHWD